jgi:hypothetical protein
VVTNTASQNPDRVNNLFQNFSVAPSEIWLVQNANSSSKFLASEAAAWGGKNVFEFFKTADGPEDNDPSKFEKYTRSLIVLGWLQGYYLEEYAEPLVDVDKIMADLQRLTDHCKLRLGEELMAAADEVFGKPPAVGGSSTPSPTNQR